MKSTGMEQIPLSAFNLSSVSFFHFYSELSAPNVGFTPLNLEIFADWKLLTLPHFLGKLLHLKQGVFYVNEPGKLGT